VHVAIGQDLSVECGAEGEQQDCFWACKHVEPRLL
jgi:hypothetical protein